MSHHRSWHIMEDVVFGNWDEPNGHIRKSATESAEPHKFINRHIKLLLQLELSPEKVIVFICIIGACMARVALIPLHQLEQNLGARDGHVLNLRQHPESNVSRNIRTQHG